MGACDRTRGAAADRPVQRLLDLLREAGAGQIAAACRTRNILDSTLGAAPSLGRWCTLPGRPMAGGRVRRCGLKGRAHVGQVALGSYLRQPHQRFLSWFQQHAKAFTGDDRKHLGGGSAIIRCQWWCLRACDRPVARRLHTAFVGSGYIRCGTGCGAFAAGVNGAALVHWLESDVTRPAPAPAGFDIWRPRGVSFSDHAGGPGGPMSKGPVPPVRPGGHLIIATFAEDGPQQCSSSAGDALRCRSAARRICGRHDAGAHGDRDPQGHRPVTCSTSATAI